MLYLFVINIYIFIFVISKYSKYEIIVNNIIPLITRFKLNTCVPYIIKYPIPALDVSNSPCITPIRHIDMFIFKAFSIVFLFDGIMSFNNISFLFAFSVFKSLILFLYVLLKPVYIFCIETIMDIKIAIVIILLAFAPRVIIISGPSATLGNEFNIIK